MMAGVGEWMHRGVVHVDDDGSVVFGLQGFGCSGLSRENWEVTRSKCVSGPK